MGKGPEQAFFQRRHTDGQQVHEKMLKITNHQGMQIKTTPVRMDIIKKARNNQCL